MFRKTDGQLIQSIRQMMDLRHQSADLKRTGSNVPNRFVPGSRLSAGLVAIAPDGEFLWILLEQALWLYHPPSHSYVGGFSLQGRGELSSLACAGTNLWVGARQGAECFILKIDGSALKSIPRGHWVSDTISNPELASRLKAFSPQQRALYDFFTGDDKSAIRQLEQSREEEANAQCLYLMATAYAELGQTGPAAHYENELKARFPESPFAKALINESQARSATTQKLQHP